MRSAWMIKMTCAYHAAITETKVKKRHVIDPCIGELIDGGRSCRGSSSEGVSPRTLFSAADVSPVVWSSRMDPDHHQVPVGAASEGGRVLQAVPQPGLQLPAAGHAARRGHCNEAVGVQREARHVHVPGRFASEERSGPKEPGLGPEEFSRNRRCI